MSHSEPIAWAVLLANRDRIYDVYAIEEEAKAIDEVVTGNHGIVPLYRSPTLTDEEREAVAYCVSCAQDYRETLDCCEQSEKYDRATRMIDAAMRLVILTVGHAPVERLGATKVTDADGAGPT
jgi:hypothetical protein